MANSATACATTPSDAVLVTDLNPPTWSWNACDSSLPTAYRVSLDSPTANTVVSTGTTFTPTAPLSAGDHTLYVAQQTSQGAWGTPVAIKMTVLSHNAVHPQGRLAATPQQPNVQEPNTAAPNGSNLQYYGYPIYSAGRVNAQSLEVVSPTGWVADDVVQGQLGDCYFDAVLAALANANPNFLNQRVKPATDSTGAALTDPNSYPLYSINFYYPRDPNTPQDANIVAANANVVQDANSVQNANQPDPNMLVWTYTTDAQFPLNGLYSMLYDQVVPDGANMKIGAALLEKGFAELNEQTDYFKSVGGPTAGSGYYTIGLGGWAYDAFVALVGHKGGVIPKADSATRLAAIHPNQGTAVVADLNSGYFKPLTALPSGATLAVMPAVPGSPSAAVTAYQYTGKDGTTFVLLDQHYYTYMQTNADGSQTWRNPWDNTSGLDGEFTLPAADAPAIFDQFAFVENVGGLSANTPAPTH